MPERADGSEFRTERGSLKLGTSISPAAGDRLTGGALDQKLFSRNSADSSPPNSFSDHHTQHLEISMTAQNSTGCPVFLSSTPPRELKTVTTSGLVRYAGLAGVVAVSLVFPCAAGLADPYSVPERALLAQAAPGKDTLRPGATGDGKEAASRKKISINVFLLSDQPNNPDETLVSRGSRYTYFSSRRLTSRARPLAEPKPRYPEGKQAEPGGAVLLQLLINERGGLDYVDVICSAPAFEKSAVDSVRGMKFKPARDKNGPVKSYMWVEIAYGRGYPCAKLPD